MPGKSVASSMISRIAHDPRDHGLYVEFCSQRGNLSCYRYNDVAGSVFDSLAQAESVGRYFLGNIRGRYDYKEIRSDEFNAIFERLEIKFQINWDKIVPLIQFS